MTVTSTTRRNDYIGTGSTGPFPFTFRILAATDLRVTIRNLSGTQTLLAYPADYSVAGVNVQAGGSITLTDALADDWRITIRRVRPLTQATQFRNQGTQYPEKQEDALDNAAMVARQQQDEIDRAFKLPETVTDVDATLPAPAASQVLAWSQDGTQLVNRVVTDEDVVLGLNGIPPVEDETARDAMFPVPMENQRVQITESGQYQRFIGGQWQVDLEPSSVMARKEDGIPPVEDAAERDAKFPTPDLGQLVRRLDTGNIEEYKVSGWEIQYLPASSIGEGVRRFATVTELVAYTPGVGETKLGYVTNNPDNTQNGLWGYDSVEAEWVKADDRTSELQVAVDQLEVTTAIVEPRVTRITDRLIDSLAYRGSSGPFPLVVDSEDRALVWIDSSGQVHGNGMLTDSNLEPPVSAVANKVLAQLDQAGYTGNGRYWPIVTDRNGRVILAYDEETDSLIGAFTATAATAIRAALIPLATVDRPEIADMNHLLFYGQSLSMGVGSEPAISTTQPYANVTFGGGPRTGGGDYETIKPLVEDDLTSGFGETPCSGAANFVSELLAIEDGSLPSSHVIISSTAGHGSYTIALLEKGSVWYSHLLAHITKGLARATDISDSYAVQAICWVQGENDVFSETDPVVYQSDMAQLQADIETDAQGITGQDSPVHLITYQTVYGVRNHPGIALAQLALAKSNPRISLATPIYHLPLAPDNTHLSNIGSAWMGHYFGRAYKRLMLDKCEVPFINPISATRRGTEITVRYDVPVRPLVLDITSLAETVDFGFVVRDDNGDVPIESVEVVNGDTVKIVTGVEPDGDVVVRYALDNQGAGLTANGGASGNLRDSEPAFVTIDGTTCPLYHVAPHFELSVITLAS